MASLNPLSAHSKVLKFPHFYHVGNHFSAFRAERTRKTATGAIGCVAARRSSGFSTICGTVEKHGKNCCPRACPGVPRDALTRPDLTTYVHTKRDQLRRAASLKL